MSTDTETTHDATINQQFTPPPGWQIGGTNVVAMGRDGTLCPSRGKVLCAIEDRDHLHVFVSPTEAGDDDEIHADHDCGDGVADRIACELDAAIGNLEVIAPAQRTDDLVTEVRSAFDRLLAPSEGDVASPETAALLSRVEAAEKLNTEYAAALKDPIRVHVLILRGDIALTRSQALHIAGATNHDGLMAQLEAAQKARHVAIENRDALAAEWLTVTTAFPPPTEKDDSRVQLSLGDWVVGLIEAAAERADAAERERDEAQFRPLGDNHHNALKCPYCNSGYAEVVKRAEKAERLIATSVCTKCGWVGIPKAWPIPHETYPRHVDIQYACGREGCDYLVSKPTSAYVDGLIAQLAAAEQREEESDAILAGLQSQLADCFRLSGADADGRTDAELAPRAVEEVRMMAHLLTATPEETFEQWWAGAGLELEDDDTRHDAAWKAWRARGEEVRRMRGELDEAERAVTEHAECIGELEYAEENKTLRAERDAAATEILNRDAIIEANGRQIADPQSRELNEEGAWQLATLVVRALIEGDASIALDHTRCTAEDCILRAIVAGAILSARGSR